MSDSTGLVQGLWNYDDILRDDGLSYYDYIQKLTFGLFFMMASEKSCPPLNNPSAIRRTKGCFFSALGAEVRFPKISDFPTWENSDFQENPHPFAIPTIPNGLSIHLTDATILRISANFCHTNGATFSQRYKQAPGRIAGAQPTAAEIPNVVSTSIRT